MLLAPETTARLAHRASIGSDGTWCNVDALLQVAALASFRRVGSLWSGPFAKVCSPLIRHSLFNAYKLWRSDHDHHTETRCDAACASVWGAL